ncbi:hypothetical protein [Microtetraspora glauca]|uniref:Uncharacterized protein n=1 Tax=Microtetraspora glauca TaxID=1996 RepID=A0ABV3GBU2_MICGL
MGSADVWLGVMGSADVWLGVMGSAVCGIGVVASRPVTGVRNAAEHAVAALPPGGLTGAGRKPVDHSRGERGRTRDVTGYVERT